MVWVLAPVERWLVRGGVSPDLLNWLGLALGVAAGLAFAAGNPGLAGWLLAAGGICDILDGRLARALNVASRYGAFVDSTLDRFAETATLLGVAWYLKSSPGLMLWAMLALAGSLLVSYARARGQALGVDFAGGVMQRAERVVLLTLGALLEASLVDRMGWARGTVMGAIVIMVALGTLGTAVYRAMVTGDRLRRAGND
jgi:CDP-diacylglycerol--glycerol-3-phosphate 3-phosphatidyltransferase